MRVAAAGVMPLETCAEDGEGYAGPLGMMGIKRPGGFAEMVAVPACAAVELPDGLDFHHAAVVMRHVPTAWNLLFNVAELKAARPCWSWAPAAISARSASRSPRT